MTSWSSEFNKYIKQKTKIKCLRTDIYFLKQCKRHEVFPKFIQIKTNKHNKDLSKLINNAKKKWLLFEIGQLYNKLIYLETQTYNLHLKLAKHLKAEWSFLDNKANIVANAKCATKSIKINKKLKILLSQKHKSTNEIINIVHNKSNINFTTEELNLLNKGLKHSLISPKPPVEDILNDLEKAITHQPHNIQTTIRKEAETIIKKLPSKQKHYEKSEFHIANELKKKDCIYLKADKGNDIIILNTADYKLQVQELLDSGPYEKLSKNPISNYNSKLNKVLNTCSNLINKKLKQKLKLPNPTLPKLHCLPKIHKPGNNYRPIVSNINSPTYNLAKWLVNSYNNLNFPNNSMIRNSKELTEILKNVKINSKSRLISFDVTSLFPNVPIPDTLQILKEELSKNNLPSEIINEYILLTKTCMEANAFSFNGQFYKQTFGTAMGNPLSPFLANLFLSHFETKVKNNIHNFPRTWIRYVDDVFAIIDTDFNINSFINQINSYYPTIKFTHELEKDKTLPFLDLEIIRENNHLEFDIHRKETNKENYIHSTSNTPYKYKVSTFYSMMHRLFNIPLSKDRFDKELKHIYKVAFNNGYEENMITKIYHKFKLKQHIHNNTTLRIEPTTKNYRKFTYYQEIHHKIANLFKKFNITLAFTNNLTMKNILHRDWDKQHYLESSGIYAINCNDCEKVYIGQTKRKIQTRFKEHINHLKNKNIYNSAIALHHHETGHNFNLENTKCLRKCREKDLNMLEAIAMKKHEKFLLNNDLSMLENPLLEFINPKNTPPPTPDFSTV